MNVTLKTFRTVWGDLNIEGEKN